MENGYNEDAIRSFEGADNVTHVRAKDHTPQELADITQSLGKRHGPIIAEAIS